MIEFMWYQLIGDPFEGIMWYQRYITICSEHTPLIKTAKFYVLSFDESLNQSTQTSELDLLVHYFNITDRRVKYISSEFLGHARHMDLFSNFANMTDEINVQG